MFCTHDKLTVTMQTLGQKIRELREDQDLSLRELAKRLGGLSAAFLSDVELGRRYPSDEVLANIASVLGVSLDELRKYDTRPPVEDLKRKAESDPTFGFALRKIMEKDVSADELMKLIEKKEKDSKK
jgi:transcriptional regulator with XRE-family HTH domain